MSSFSFGRAFCLAAMEFRKWVFNPRMVAAVSLMLFAWNFAISPLLGIAEQMHSPLNTLEPYVAVLNSEQLIFICPAVFLFLISDYPRIDAGSLFLLHRMKKAEWAAGQVLFFAMAVFSYLSAVFIVTFLTTATRSLPSNAWSHAVTYFTAEFPENALSFEANLITQKLYNQISPIGAAVSATILVGLYMLVTALLHLLFYVFNLRKAGIIASASVIAVGGAILATKPRAMWAFPTVHTIISFHFTDYYREPVFPLWGSFLYLFGLAAILVVIILKCIKRAKFDINQVG